MRWKLVIAYEGTDFLGWQSQTGGKTVQDTIEAALQKVLKKEMRLHGASRTDSGVHAWGQVAHFDADWSHSPQKLQLAIQSLLPETVFIREILNVPENFHARFSAKGKIYYYKIKLSAASPFESRYLWAYDNYPINFGLLKKTLRLFKGKHVFTSFAGWVNKEETPLKDLKVVSAERKGDYVIIKLQGSGFLYKMARSIVGTAMEVARGKLSVDRVKDLLKNPKRTHEVITAPAKGLILDKVIY